MARRALRKLKSVLDVDRWLISGEQIKAPFVAAAVFGRAAPLEVEVGSGKGLFLLSAASAHAERNYLGIEVAGKYAHLIAARLAKAGLANARIVYGDALALFRHAFVDGTIDDVHVYFPDPWWKKRHKKRRVMNESFVRDVERVLVDGGRLHFWTDVEEYFQTTLALLAEATTLAGPLAVDARAAEHDLDYQTHFERRTRQAGQPVFRALYRKMARAAGSQVVS